MEAPSVLTPQRNAGQKAPEGDRMTEDVPMILVMGACGVGKSTIARGLADRMSARFIEADDFHPADNKALMAKGIPLTDDNRWPWLDAIAAEAQSRPGLSVLACSALRRVYRDRLRLTCRPMPIIHLHADADLLKARVAARRDHYMPPSLVQSQLDTLEPPTEDEMACILPAFDTPEDIVARATGFVTRHLDRALIPAGVRD